MIVYVIEPNHGKMLDPAIGTAGMFLQSSHFMELSHQNPTEQTTFYGLEKNPITIRLAKMNLAVHGRKVISRRRSPIMKTRTKWLKRQIS